jgi:hypothetical protein
MHVDLECGDCLALENEALKAEIERLKGRGNDADAVGRRNR